jgi:Zn-dependent peptidase ImmA (M78 family)
MPGITANSGEGTFFGDIRRPTVVCRSSQSKQRAELQANVYASCLLMPRELVRQAWREMFGNDSPRVLTRKDRIPLLSDIDDEVAEQVRGFDQEVDELALTDFARPFAEKFLVSPIAMRIRLERLGFLSRAVSRQRSFLGSHMIFQERHEWHQHRTI